MSLESGAGRLQTDTAVTMARESVLVVDDERDILELVKYNLDKEGYQVTVVATGEDALAAARTKLPDIVDPRPHAARRGRPRGLPASQGRPQDARHPHRHAHRQGRRGRRRHRPRARRGGLRHQAVQPARAHGADPRRAAPRRRGGGRRRDDPHQGPDHPPRQAPGARQGRSPSSSPPPSSASCCSWPGVPAGCSRGSRSSTPRRETTSSSATASSPTARSTCTSCRCAASSGAGGAYIETVRGVGYRLQDE